MRQSPDGLLPDGLVRVSVPSALRFRIGAVDVMWSSLREGGERRGPASAI